VNEAWRRDLDWAVLIWLALTTGARRGELSGLRWNHIDIVGAVLTEHWERHAARAAAIGVKLGPDAFVFSLAQTARRKRRSLPGPKSLLVSELGEDIDTDRDGIPDIYQ
jgi:integrase